MKDGLFASAILLNMNTIMLVGQTPLLDRCATIFDTFGNVEAVQGIGVSTELLIQMNEVRPDAVLYDVSSGTPARPDTNPTKSFKVNSATASKVALFCRMNDTRMWMVSDASVFPGHGKSSRDEDPFPVHTFGLSRLLGERAVHTLCPRSTIVRLGWLYGPEMPESPPMIAEDTVNGSRSIANVQAGIVGSPTFLGDAAGVLASNILTTLMVEPMWEGETFHLAPFSTSDWYEYLTDEYPKVEYTSIKASREIYQGVRNASLVPSIGWEIAEGGLERFREEVKRGDTT